MPGAGLRGASGEASAGGAFDASTLTGRSQGWRLKPIVLNNHVQPGNSLKEGYSSCATRQSKSAPHIELAHFTAEYGSGKKMYRCFELRGACLLSIMSVANHIASHVACPLPVWHVVGRSTDFSASSSTTPLCVCPNFGKQAPLITFLLYGDQHSSGIGHSLTSSTALRWCKAIERPQKITIEV